MLRSQEVRAMGLVLGPGGALSARGGPMAEGHVARGGLRAPTDCACAVVHLVEQIE